MKLISMTDFVLKQSESIKSNMIGYGEFIDKVVNYANFLKQPLTLRMFVPCDDNGNVLKPCGCSSDKGTCKKEYDYQKAKEKVLFEGFEVKGNYLMYYDFAYMMKYELEGKTVENIIDEIPNNSLQLTQNALKKIGL